MFEIGTLLLPFQIKLALGGLGGIIFNELQDKLVFLLDGGHLVKWCLTLLTARPKAHTFIF